MLRGTARITAHDRRIRPAPEALPVRHRSLGVSHAVTRADPAHLASAVELALVGILVPKRTAVAADVGATVRPPCHPRTRRLRRSPCRELVDSPVRGAALGEAGRRRVLRLFDAAVINQGVVAEYFRLAGGSRARSLILFDQEGRRRPLQEGAVLPGGLSSGEYQELVCHVGAVGGPDRDADGFPHLPAKGHFG